MFILLLILELYKKAVTATELEDEDEAERRTPDNCDNSSAMGSAEDTRDSRTVACTGWW